MGNKLILLGGLPRSGNTLLSALLNQNPAIYVTTTSSFIGIMSRSYWMFIEPKNEELATDKLQKAMRPFLMNMQRAYHSELTDRKYVIDKRRQWQDVESIEMFIDIYGCRPKILCPVRSIPEIISSFDSVFKNNDIELDIKKHLSGNRFLDSYLQLQGAYDSKYSDCLHLIEFEDLIQDTQNTLNKVYDYLGFDRFTHNLKDIKALEEEADYSLVGLHTLKPKVEAKNHSKDNVDAFKEFIDWDFWR